MRDRVRFIGWSLVSLCAGAALGLGATGCGGGRAGGTGGSSIAVAADFDTITTSAIPPGQRFRGDGDADNPRDGDGNGDSDSMRVGGPDSDSDNPVPASYRLPDEDDRATFAYGHSPGAAGPTIAGVVRRYYAAAAADNGAAACSLLLPSLANSVPLDYGQATGPPYLRGGKSCQAVLSMLFRHFHSELLAPIEVLQVRNQGATAQAVLSSRSMRASHVFLTRHAGSWTIVDLLGEALP
jgi:hypothetical protein